MIIQDSSMTEQVWVGVYNSISLLTLVIILATVLLILAVLWYWGEA